MDASSRNSAVPTSLWTGAKPTEEVKSSGGATPIYDKNNSVNNNNEGTKKLEVSLYRAKGRTAQATNLVHHRSEGNIDSKKNIKDPVGDNGKGKNEVSQQSARTISRPPPPPSPPPPTDFPPSLTASTYSPPPPPKNSAPRGLGELQKVYLNFKLGQEKQIVTEMEKLIPFNQFKLPENRKKYQTIEPRIALLRHNIKELAKYYSNEDNVDEKTLKQKKESVIKAFDDTCDLIKNNADSKDEAAGVRKSLVEFMNKKISYNSSSDW